MCSSAEVLNIRLRLLYEPSDPGGLQFVYSLYRLGEHTGASLVCHWASLMPALHRSMGGHPGIPSPPYAWLCEAGYPACTKVWPREPPRRRGGEVGVPAVANEARRTKAHECWDLNSCTTKNVSHNPPVQCETPLNARLVRMTILAPYTIEHDRWWPSRWWLAKVPVEVRAWSTRHCGRQEGLVSLQSAVCGGWWSRSDTD